MTATNYPADRGDWDSTDNSADDTLLKQMRRDYKHALDHPDWKAIRDQAELDDRALSVSGPWTDADRDARNKPGEERPCIHLDQLSQYPNALINEARSNPIAIKAEPSGGKANEKTAELRANRIRSIEQESNATQARMTAFECMARHGFGAYGIDIEYKAWDDFRQVIRFREFLNSYSVLWDPEALKRDWSDMKFWFDLYRMSKEDFKTEYSKATTTDFARELINLGWQDDESVQVARYWYIKKEKRHVLLVEAPQFPGKPFKVIKENLSKGIKLPDGNEVVLEGFKVTDKAIVLKDGTEWPIKDSKTDYEPSIYHCVCSGAEILSDPELWPGKWIPRFPLVGKQHFEKHGTRAQRVIESYIRKGRDGNMLFDFYVSSEAENVGMTCKSPYKMVEGQQEGHEDEWRTVHKVPRGFIQYKIKTEDGGEQILPPPTRDTYEPPIQALEIGKESTRRSIQAAIGSYGTTRLDDTNVKSGIALDRIKQSNDMGSYHFMDALKTMIQHDGRVINDLLDNVETDAMDVGLLSLDGKYTTKRINDGPVNEEDPNTYKLTDEDQHEITISVGAAYQSQREEAQSVTDTLVSNLQNIAQVIGPEKATQVLASSLKMRQLGPEGDKLIKILVPEIDGQPDPKQMMAQQEQTMKLAEALGERVKVLELEKQSKLMDIESREKMAALSADVEMFKARLSALQSHEQMTSSENMKAEDGRMEMQKMSMAAQQAEVQQRIDAVAAEDQHQAAQQPQPESQV
jgi:hypothetical protein